MGIIYIGDRTVGKTHLARELANPKRHYVKVTNLSYDGSQPQATSEQTACYQKSLQLEVELPTGFTPLTVDWIDTPGEIWRSNWQTNNPDEWENFLTTITASEGILLILPPYREILLPKVKDPTRFATQKQWCNRFELWVDFFASECNQLRHLLICLNMADLFCQNLKEESRTLAYIPNDSYMNWQERDDYVLHNKIYFRPIYSQLNKLKMSTELGSIRCFITSIYSRELLELPWIYLATFLAK